MKIKLEWAGPITLKARKASGYDFSDVEPKLENRAAIYVFARAFAGRYTPIYIGKGRRVQKRLERQFNSIELMDKVKNWNKVDPGNAALRTTGARVLFIGYLSKPTRKDLLDNALLISERSLIEHAMTEGHKIVNIQMTKMRYDEICSTGADGSESFAPREMYPRIMRKRKKLPKADQED